MSELEQIREELAQAQEKNKINEVYKTKFLSVMTKLSNINNNANNNDPALNTGEDGLIENSDTIIDNLLTTFKDLPEKKKEEVLHVKDDGNQFLHRISIVEQNCALASFNAKLALNRNEEVKQYLKVDQLLLFGLKDIPKSNGYEFSTYVAEKLRSLLPSLPEEITAKTILRNISVSHILKSKPKRNRTQSTYM